MFFRVPNTPQCECDTLNLCANEADGGNYPLDKNTRYFLKDLVSFYEILALQPKIFHLYQHKVSFVDDIHNTNACFTKGNSVLPHLFDQLELHGVEVQ